MLSSSWFSLIASVCLLVQLFCDRNTLSEYGAKVTTGTCNNLLLARS